MIRAVDIQDEILAGLPNERERLEDARVGADFYRGRFDAYSTRPRSGLWQGPRFARESRIMTWLVDTLGSHLYAEGPSRTLPDHPEASQWLASVYKAGAVDALLQAADKWSTVGEVAAIQVLPTEDPDRPIRHVLWPAHQLAVWESEDDPLSPVAVAVIDRFDSRRRLRLWTAEGLWTYATDKVAPNQTTGGTAYRMVADPEVNPFGIIPFAFVHFNYPATEFWSGGPGEQFRGLNDYINNALTEVGDALRYCAKPVIKTYGVREGWSPPTPIQPGDIWNVPPEGIDASGNGIPPQVEPLQFDLGFVDAYWTDIQSYLDHSMECAQVPPTAFRMIQGTAPSGASIVAEQLPLTNRAKGRQRPFGFYEQDLARVTLRVGAAHLSANGIATAGRLAEAADHPDLTLRWPRIGGRVPDPTRDAEDQWRLTNRLASRTLIVMERNSFTREEAEAYLDQVELDLQREAARAPEPATVPTSNPSDTPIPTPE